MSERLAKALEWWHWGDGLDVTARYNVEDYGAHFHPVLAAARAYHEGTDINWCEAHDKIGGTLSGCSVGWLEMQQSEGESWSCRMVVRRLVVPVKEETE